MPQLRRQVPAALRFQLLENRLAIARRREYIAE